MAEEKKDMVTYKAEKGRIAPAEEGSIFLNMQRFADAQRVATLLAASTMVPEQFRGNVANCVIALNLAGRLHIDPFMMMQAMYVVHGRPGVEAKLALALIEGEGRFGRLQYKFSGSGMTEQKVERPDKCAAFAIEKKTGHEVVGPEVTWSMAIAEGWTKPKGYGDKQQISKWQTMPQLMFMYRAAMFFARVHTPGALLGLRTVDELEDMVDVTPKPDRMEDEGKESKQEAIQNFHNSIPEDILARNDGSPAEFIELTAKARQVSTDDLMVFASKHLDAFWAAYRKWEAKRREGESGALAGQSPEPGVEGAEATPEPPKEPNQPPTSTKENGPLFDQDRSGPMEEVKDLEKTDPALFKQACREAEIVRPMSESAAIIVLRKAEEISKRPKDKKKK